MMGVILSDALIKVEVKVFKKEGLLNILNNKCIRIKNAQSIDAVTIRFDMYYMDYKDLKDIIKRLDGKVTIVSKGKKFKAVNKVKRNMGLCLGAFLFVFIILGLSKFIWRIEIEEREYLPPYEIRTYLEELGVKRGVLKSKVDVYDLEKKIERNIEEIMWINIRMEGSTMVVRYEEKSLTKMQGENEELIGTDKVARMDGTIKRIYTTSGAANVKEGQTVKKGDVLIRGQQVIKDSVIDGESLENPVIPEGRVIADTFYEKVVEIQVSGEQEVRTGEEEEEIFVELFGKKIYLKKVSKDFTSYDKIEKKGNFINKNIYYEKELKEITKEKQDIINEAVYDLRLATQKELSRQAVIIDEKVEFDYLEDGNIRLKVLFIVEQDIVSF